jgi:hypothetical protein
MRGIDSTQVQRVVLATADHPKVQGFQRWLSKRTTADLEAKFHDRREERALLAKLLGAPIEHLLTREAMVEQYQRFAYRPPMRLPPPTCRDCRHCAPDRYRAGGYVCWQGWEGGPPRRLTTLKVCGALQDRRPGAGPPTWHELRDELTAYLAAYGIRYSPARWKAHMHDLQREAGATGFDVGRQWEADIRAWIAAQYGERFFLPQRWLMARDSTGTVHYREVDGIEQVDARHAFVYEIKHHTQGYAQLMREYIPLLRLAYPQCLFTPLEINASNPYSGLSRAEPCIQRISTLDERAPNGQYQLFVLSNVE